MIALSIVFSCVIGVSAVDYLRKYHPDKWAQFKRWIMEDNPSGEDHAKNRYN